MVDWDNDYRSLWVLGAQELGQGACVIGSLLSYFIAIGGGYIYVLPSFTQAFQGSSWDI